MNYSLLLALKIIVQVRSVVNGYIAYMGKESKEHVKIDKKEKKQSKSAGILESSAKEGVSLPPPPLFNKKDKLSSAIDQADAIDSTSGISKMASGVLKMTDGENGVKDYGMAGLGMLEGASEFMGKTASHKLYEDKLGKIGKRIGGISKGINYMTGNVNEMDIMKDTMSLASRATKNIGLGRISAFLSGAVLPLEIGIMMFQIFENFFGALDEVKAKTKYKNFRYGFAKGIASAILEIDHGTEKFNHKGGGRGIPEKINQIGIGANNRGVDTGYHFASSLPLEFLDATRKHAEEDIPNHKLSLMDSDRNHAREIFEMEGGQLSIHSLSSYLLPMVDDLFEQWNKERKIEEKEKAERARNKEMEEDIVRFDLHKL